MPKLSTSRTQLSKKSLVTDTLNKMRTAIIIGEYPIGSRLTEINLSEHYQVSRGTIRSTLQSLAAEGLIQYLDNGGCIVVGLDEKTVKDITDFRFMLEHKAGEIILRDDSIVYTPLIQTLDQLVTKEDSPVYQKSKIQYFVNQDLEFHRNLVYIAGNKPIYNAWLSIMPVIHELLRLRAEEETDYARDLIKRFQPSHKLFVDYAITRDPRLLDHIEQHIAGTAERVLATLGSVRNKNS